MDRVFQHYEGAVDTLTGASFSVFRSLEDKTGSDVFLLWLFDSQGEIWYRVFIDGWYCGIDRYDADESDSDLDDGVILVDHSSWFRNAVVVRADVSIPDGLDGGIVLSLEFADRSCNLICQSQDGDCRLEFNGPNK